MARRVKVGTEIRAKVSVDLSRFRSALADLEAAVSGKIVDEALTAGGRVIQKAAISKAPGSGIVVEKMGGKRLGSGVGTGLMKKDISAGGSYVVIGPDREHWYYRFAELGVKEHGPKRKSTERQRRLRLEGRRAEAKSLRGKTRPALRFYRNGVPVFARKVRGFAARPFMEPAAREAGEAAIREIGKVISRKLREVKG
jgi:HK97 gp10 family phage protein